MKSSWRSLATGVYTEKRETAPLAWGFEEAMPRAVPGILR